MRYDYDVLAPTFIKRAGDGRTRMLGDVAKAHLRLDSRNHQFRTAYDPFASADRCLPAGRRGCRAAVGLTVYGETRPNPEAKNLRRKPVQLFDQAGVVTSDDYIQGQLVEWSTPARPGVQDDAELAYRTTGSRHLHQPHPLRRPQPPDGTGHTAHSDHAAQRHPPSFNEANLLEKVDVNLRGAAVATPSSLDIDYNAKGQRTRITYGSGATPNLQGVTTTYEYDPLTFRPTRLTTTRPAGLNGLATQLFKNAGTVQDLHYTYDPAGNITRIADDALPTLFFANQPVTRWVLYYGRRVPPDRGRKAASLSVSPLSSSACPRPPTAITPTPGSGRSPSTQRQCGTTPSTTITTRWEISCT